MIEDNDELWINYYIAVRCPENKVNEIRKLLKDKCLIAWDRTSFGRYKIIPDTPGSGSGENNK